ncbi:zonular occludens toxin domain-containing protein [Xanthomonas phaseoli pv. phaseoli]|uniref:zonular occludens toxin domain-containing protein n=1 Tax=Xanthomonas TaxID=338 RepID=UPI00062B94E3|nr:MULTISPECIES: zonular occludens toxin domain-containing protein [Xanthomonas]MBV6839645.1 zonular occludens toxin domain-containing protein [Xanthomonas campestris pv. merremiae]ASK96791.1 zonular occludens toxin family protein [Xanthomonas citri pv. vignicola]KKY07181.1 zonular occludens toxin family protein [Xanthomonas phaseoli pv. phaseoli]KKY07188.1 zonular occludens toxin family protein [Xanthomonas phaseoli pv. phaseoli]MBO9737338.1 zonular occludens toxin family protein [Xanthomonas
MIYWYTGQPGHGKTLHAIDHAIDFRNAGRLVYVCNVRGFKHADARMLEMTPEQFIDWPNSLPDGAVCLVDEAYEHGMLPKRRPGSTVPHHVEQLAKHRHRGLDFIFVSQSPDRQCDDFVQDLIERHVHVRRRFGLPFAHLRTFDKYEKNPERGHPLTLKRVKLPKRPMGLYESTVLDTSERSIPWYYPTAILLLIAIIVGAWLTVGRVHDQLTGELHTTPEGSTPKGAAQNGAVATVGAAPPPMEDPTPTRAHDYVGWMTPRVPGQPWTAPAYDALAVPSNQPPRLFCMQAGAGQDAHGKHSGASCSCITDQGTAYALDEARCAIVATRGQYEPFLDMNQREARRMTDLQQSAHYSEEARRIRDPEPGVTIGRQMRSQGTFPESPGYQSSTYTGPTTLQM